MSRLKKNRGFTFIELIVVIVLLSILSVIAVSRFLNAESDARSSVIKGVASALKTARDSTRARYRLDGESGTATVTLDGASVTTLSGGMPTGDSAGIEAALRDQTGITFAHNAGVSTVTLDGYSGSSCDVVYTASVGTIVATVGGC